MARIWRLVKIFDEYNDIKIKGKSCKSRYDALFTLVKNQSTPVTLDKITEYVNNLQAKYPNRGFMLKRIRLNNKTFYIITKKSINAGKIVKDRIPIYIDIDNQEFYIPQSYIKKQKKLANYVIMRVLGALGVAKVKYVSTGA